MAVTVFLLAYSVKVTATRMKFSKEYHHNTTLDSTTVSLTTDGRFGDSLDIIKEHLPVMLGTNPSESLSSFSSSSHFCRCSKPCKYSHTANINLTLGCYWTT